MQKTIYVTFLINQLASHHDFFHFFFYKMKVLLPAKIPWHVLILDFASAKFLQGNFTTVLINMKLT